MLSNIPKLPSISLSTIVEIKIYFQIYSTLYYGIISTIVEIKICFQIYYLYERVIRSTIVEIKICFQIHTTHSSSNNLQ